MSSDEADANKNGAITVQEAFEFAERMVADSYETAGNLATEHPQLVGDTAGSFNVALLEARIATTEELETLIGELTVLEEEIEILRSRRDEMDGDVYLGQLQELLLELALVQQSGANRNGIGATVWATVGGVTRRRDIISGDSFLAGGPAEIHLGLGSATAVDLLV